MKNTVEKSQGKEMLKTLITRAWKDETFKKELIASPELVIEQITGKTITATNKKVFVLDQSNPDHIYINIPAKPNLDNLELTENQLESIAGGGLLDDLKDLLDDFLEDFWYGDGPMT